MSVYQILKQVGDTSSRLEKEAILRKNKDNKLLARVFKMAYDKQINFFISEAPEDSELNFIDTSRDLTYGLDMLEKWIVSRAVTGHAALTMIKTILASVGDDDRHVLRRVIEKDLKVGATISTANKIWKNLIPVPKFMLAETDPSDIVYPAYSQIKEDGTRAKFIWNGYNVSLISRNGNEIETLRHFDSWANLNLEPGTILDGELVTVDKNGNRAPRKVSNGIVNKMVKGSIAADEIECVRFVVWDIETSKETYDKRLEIIKSLASNSDRVLLIETEEVANYEEALAHYRSARSRGLEGTILKNIKNLWVPKRSKDLVKFKAEYVATFKVVGFEHGTKGTKNENRIGALLIESEDGLVKTNVGIFKDFPSSVRDEWLTDLPEYVDVLYNERIKSKDPKVTTESLFLPRVVAVRMDKSSADTRDEMIELEKAVDNVA